MWPRAEGVSSLSDLEDCHRSTYSWKSTSLLQHAARDKRADKSNSRSKAIHIWLLCGPGQTCQLGQSNKLVMQWSLDSQCRCMVIVKCFTAGQNVSLVWLRSQEDATEVKANSKSGNS